MDISRTSGSDIESQEMHKGINVGIAVLGTSGDQLIQFEVALKGIELGYFETVTFITGRDTIPQDENSPRYDTASRIRQKVIDLGLKDRIEIVEAGPHTEEIIQMFSGGDVDPNEVLPKFAIAAHEFNEVLKTRFDNGRPDMLLGSTGGMWFVPHDISQAIIDLAIVADPQASFIDGSAVVDIDTQLKSKGDFLNRPWIKGAIKYLIEDTALGKKLSHILIANQVYNALGKEIAAARSGPVKIRPGARSKMIGRYYFNQLENDERLNEINSIGKKLAKPVQVRNRIYSSTVEGLTIDEENFLSTQELNNRYILTIIPGGSLDISTPELFSEILLKAVNERPHVSVFIANPRNFQLPMLEGHERIFVSKGAVDLVKVLERSHGAGGHAGSGTATNAFFQNLAGAFYYRFKEQLAIVKDYFRYGIGHEPKHYSQMVEDLPMMIDYLVEKSNEIVRIGINTEIEAGNKQIEDVLRDIMKKFREF